MINGIHPLVICYVAIGLLFWMMESFLTMGSNYYHLVEINATRCRFKRERNIHVVMTGNIGYSYKRWVI